MMRVHVPRPELPHVPVAKHRKEMATAYRRERYLYAAHDLRAEVWGEQWLAKANSDGTINSNLAYLCEGKLDSGDGMSQWDWAKYKLRADQSTRRAVMHFNRPEHQHGTNKDFPSALTGTFLVRDNRLLYNVVLASQDVVNRFPYDLAFFIEQQCRMALELDIEIGEYTQIVHSLYAFKCDLERAEEMILC